MKFRQTDVPRARLLSLSVCVRAEGESRCADAVIGSAKVKFPVWC